MPDHRDHRSADPARQIQTHPPAIHSPALARVVGVVRGFAGFAGAVSITVLAAEMVVPPAYKPSTLIGGFHGHIEAADVRAKIDAATDFTRRNTEAAAQPPAIAAMETEAFRQQMQVLADSMQTQSAIANTVDAGCAVGQVIPRGDRDWGWLGDLLRSGCGVGDQVRGAMMGTLRQGSQDNSVLINRPRAGAPAR